MFHISKLQKKLLSGYCGADGAGAAAVHSSDDPRDSDSFELHALPLDCQRC